MIKKISKSLLFLIGVFLVLFARGLSARPLVLVGIYNQAVENIQVVGDSDGEGFVLSDQLQIGDQLY